MADKPLREVRLVIDNAEEVSPPDPPDHDDDPRRGRGDGGAHLILPDKCPVIPLGVNGDDTYYLDAMRQMRKVPADKHSRLRIQHLFGAEVHLLEEFWPRLTAREDRQTGEVTFVVTGWKPEVAALALTAAAAKRGLWDPMSRTRGRGAWINDDGKLMLHCGDLVLVGPKWEEAGLIEDYVYPAGPPIMRPATGIVKAGKNNPVEWLYALLKSWNWRRQQIDALLLLGWIGASIIGGALDWRPLAWITGTTGSGKSTLHELIGLLFGENGLIQVSNTSPAGVWQTLQHDSVPVNIDELEARADTRKIDLIIELARWAASGAKILRGGGEHKAVEFTIRSCFLFSSEFIPPLHTADRNRMAILELDALNGEKPPKFDKAQLRDVGQKLRRRLVDGWPLLADRLDTYRSALQAVGHTARGQDVFGTLLAVADIMLHDEAPDPETIAEIAEALDVENLAETQDNASEQQRALQLLATTAIPLAASGFTQRPVAAWAARATSESIDDNQAEAARVLGMYGLRVIEENGEAMFAISNDNVELAKIFAETSFLRGVWVQAFRRLPGMVIPRGKNGKPKNIWFPGGATKATLIPLKLLVDPDDEGERQRHRREPEFTMKR